VRSLRRAGRGGTASGALRGGLAALRFARGSGPLTTNPDGSLTLPIQQHRPDDQLAQANWLPAPDTPFNLTMRRYGPATAVLDGTYRLPAVAKRR